MHKYVYTKQFAKINPDTVVRPIPRPVETYINQRFSDLNKREEVKNSLRTASSDSDFYKLLLKLLSKDYKLNNGVFTPRSSDLPEMSLDQSIIDRLTDLLEVPDDGDNFHRNQAANGLKEPSDDEGIDEDTYEVKHIDTSR